MLLPRYEMLWQNLPQHRDEARPDWGYRNKLCIRPWASTAMLLQQTTTLCCLGLFHSPQSKHPVEPIPRYGASGKGNPRDARNNFVHSYPILWSLKASKMVITLLVTRMAAFPGQMCKTFAGPGKYHAN